MNEVCQKILIVDDEEGVRTSISGILSDEGFDSVHASSGEQALQIVKASEPNLVILDIWMPGMDGIETLKAIKNIAPNLPVIMISGHATISTAIQATKLGAQDFIEKPLDLERTVVAVKQALNLCAAACGETESNNGEEEDPLASEIPTAEIQEQLIRAVFSEQKARGRALPQRTLAGSALIYGHGVHTGQKSGLKLVPLPENSGIHFSGVASFLPVPAYADFVESTGLATTLKRQHTQVSTIEHLMSALHAYKISNLLIKCNGEVPVLDGSSLEFCKLFEEIGIKEQAGEWYEIEIDRTIRVGNEREYIQIEPAEEFEIFYRLEYPAPVGVQEFSFKLGSSKDFLEQIAAARTFGFVKDISALQKQGLGLGGRFDNFVLYGENGPINGNLRFDNEAVRHKILDLIGDIYLLGRPLRGKVTACMTGHSDNLALVQAIKSQLL